MRFLDIKRKDGTHKKNSGLEIFATPPRECNQDTKNFVQVYLMYKFEVHNRKLGI